MKIPFFRIYAFFNCKYSCYSNHLIFSDVHLLEEIRQCNFWKVVWSLRNPSFSNATSVTIAALVLVFRITSTLVSSKFLLRFLYNEFNSSISFSYMLIYIVFQNHFAYKRKMFWNLSSIELFVCSTILSYDQCMCICDSISVNDKKLQYTILYLLMKCMCMQVL